MSYQLYPANYQPPANPVEALAPEKKAAFKKLREVVNKWMPELGQEEKDHLTDLTLYRYLHGYSYNVEEAAKILKKNVEWRGTYKPYNVRLKDVESVAKQGYLYNLGNDKEGRPVIYLIVARDKIENNDEAKKLKFKHFAYVVERATQRMPPEIWNATWIVDLQGASISLGLVQGMKGIFDELGEYYAERMARLILINYGWGISMIWTFLKPLLYENTVQKWLFLASAGTAPEKIAAEISKYIDLSQLSSDVCGKYPFKFDWDNELQRESQEIAAIEALKKKPEPAPQ